MRIIGGALAGRRLAAPKMADVRPTSDRVREALGSALEARDGLRAQRVLDLFAGTGALGLEALSRGAEQLVAVDSGRAALRHIDAAAAVLGLRPRTRTLNLDLFGRSERIVAALQPLGPFGLVFIDPPYARVAELQPLLDTLVSANLLQAHALVALEHATREAPPASAGLQLLAGYRYGDTSVALLGPIA